MVAAGAPSISPMRKPSGSTVPKQPASARPGFQPSAAAQSTASAISCGRIARMRRPLSASADDQRGVLALAFGEAARLHPVIGAAEQHRIVIVDVLVAHKRAQQL